MKESYQVFKARQQKEFDSFEGIFFAFSQKQLDEGMQKVGFDSSDNLKDKIVSLGMGGFIRKDRVKALDEMSERHAKEREEAYKDEDFLVSALAYELANHEYCITRDPTDAINSLTIDPEIIMGAILEKAIAQHNKGFYNC